MNIKAQLASEPIQPDLGSIVAIQAMIRSAIIDDDEISARYLDHWLADKPLARIAALYIAQMLYDIRRHE